MLRVNSKLITMVDLNFYLLLLDMCAHVCVMHACACGLTSATGGFWELISCHRVCMVSTLTHRPISAALI